MRKQVLMGNWKCHKSVADSIEFSKQLVADLPELAENVIVGIAPTHLSLAPVIEVCKDSPVQVGAQSGFATESGAFTGQVSMHMIKQAEADFCLIGHSEQRQFFGESDETVNERLRVALGLSLTPVVCIGESLQEREEGKTNEVLETQIRQGCRDISLSSGEDLILAYEPVWAIGTGKTATPEMAQDAHAFVRSVLKSIFAELGDDIVIQYGGSVKPANAPDLKGMPDIDGFLIGGASLETESFIAIINS